MADAHKKLLSGYHLNEHDGSLWHEVSQQHEAYQSLFNALGHTLVYDSRGYFYLDSKESTVTMGKTSQLFALTLYPLVEYLADQGLDPVNALFEQTLNFTLMSDLVTHNLALFEQLGISSSSDLRKDVMLRMVRLGYAREHADGFKLNPPCFRYIDAVLSLEDSQDTHAEIDHPTAEQES